LIQINVSSTSRGFDLETFNKLEVEVADEIYLLPAVPGCGCFGVVQVATSEAKQEPARN
jgi:hypothetical protein